MDSATYFQHPPYPTPAIRLGRTQALMIPNNKRAKKLDDLLRVLGFHSRASGSFKAALPASATRSEKNNSKSKDAAAAGGKLGGGCQKREALTQEEKEESMWKRIEVSKKRRPETPAEQPAAGTGAELRWEFWSGVLCAVDARCRWMGVSTIINSALWPVFFCLTDLLSRRLYPIRHEGMPCLIPFVLQQ